MTRCDRTGLTKPECHCPACTAALIAAHAPGAGRAGAPPARSTVAGAPAPGARRS